MKSTVAHSALLVVVAAVALVSFRAAVHPAVHAPSPNAALLAAPLAALAQLLPGLVLGWFTRRHPLLVGAAAGVVALLAAQSLPLLRLEPNPLIGQTVAVAMTVAVAALAGRALRRRFSSAGVPAAAL